MWIGLECNPDRTQSNFAVTGQLLFWRECVLTGHGMGGKNAPEECRHKVAKILLIVVSY